MDPFEQSHGLYKSDKQKQQFQGPECKKVLRKLVELREYVTEDLHCFVDYWKASTRSTPFHFNKVLIQIIKKLQNNLKNFG